jgi:hypothetical protein
MATLDPESPRRRGRDAHGVWARAGRHRQRRLPGRLDRPGRQLLAIAPRARDRHRLGPLPGRLAALEPHGRRAGHRARPRPVRGALLLPGLRGRGAARVRRRDRAPATRDRPPRASRRAQLTAARTHPTLRSTSGRHPHRHPAPRRSAAHSPAHPRRCRSPPWLPWWRCSTPGTPTDGPTRQAHCNSATDRMAVGSCARAWGSGSSPPLRACGRPLVGQAHPGLRPGAARP